VGLLQQPLLLFGLLLQVGQEECDFSRECGELAADGLDDLQFLGGQQFVEEWGILWKCVFDLFGVFLDGYAVIE